MTLSITGMYVPTSSTVNDTYKELWKEGTVNSSLISISVTAWMQNT